MRVFDNYLLPETSGGQTLAFSTSSAQSSAVGSQIEYVQITSTQDVYVEFGSDPTATSSSMFIPGDSFPRTYKIRPEHKIAALRVSADGNLYIHQMTR